MVKGCVHVMCVWGGGGGMHGKGGACCEGACVSCVCGEGCVYVMCVCDQECYAWQKGACMVKDRVCKNASGWYASYWNAFLFNITIN